MVLTRLPYKKGLYVALNPVRICYYLLFSVLKELKVADSINFLVFASSLPKTLLAANGV